MERLPDYFHKRAIFPLNSKSPRREIPSWECLFSERDQLQTLCIMGLGTFFKENNIFKLCVCFNLFLLNCFKIINVETPFFWAKASVIIESA